MPEDSTANSEPADIIITSDEKYKDYCKSESDEAYTTILKNQEEYDKQLLTLSTGLLAVLVAFLKDLVHLDSSIYQILLYLGFVGLGLTIVSVIVSFQISIKSLEAVRVYWKEHYDGNTGYPFPEKGASWVKRINWAGGISFIIGVTLSFLFITTNLAHQSRIGGTHEIYEDTRRSYGQAADFREPHAPGGEHQSSYPSCPEGTHCRYESTDVYEVGDTMTDKRITVNDGAPSKNPQWKVNGGQIPKKPITTGSKDKPK